MPTIDYTTLLANAIDNSNLSGLQRYGSIEYVHNLARMNEDNVIYPENRVVKITVPNSSGEILLSPYTDFNGCIFEVEACIGASINLFAFDPQVSPTSVTVNKNLLCKDSYVYGANNELDSSPKLLIIEDQTVWTLRGSDPSTADEIKRRDILYVRDNIVQNDPIATYNNSESNPLCKYINVSTEQKVFKNLTFKRTSSSNLINLLAIRNQYNVKIENITVKEISPVTVYHDRCINVVNSANIEMNNITIENTYSAYLEWGYGITMVNVWDSRFTNIVATKPEKGVFCNDDINIMSISDSSLNRVDVHCYGRDITCTNCLFTNTSANLQARTNNVFNRFSSFFGKLIYNNCVFSGFLPVRIDSDYNVYTAFDLELEGCSITVENRFRSIVNMDRIDPSSSTTRNDLLERCLPNISIRNLTIHFPANITEFSIIRIANLNYTGNIQYMDTLLVDVTSFTQVEMSPINIFDSNCILHLQNVLRRGLDMQRRIESGT